MGARPFRHADRVQVCTRLALIAGLGVWIQLLRAAPGRAGPLGFAPSAPLAAWEPSRVQDSSLPRHAGRGFAAGAVQKRKRSKIDSVQLKADHGEKAAAIERVLKGKPAATPEDMVRARFSACRSKDAVFMARTERDSTRPSTDTRVRGWAVTFGLEERDEAVDGAAGGAEALQTIQGLEIIAAEGNEVEFKVDCGENGVLHERSIFEKDPKWGYIYTGEAVFDKYDKS